MEFGMAIYEHAARFVGESPWRVSRDADLLRLAHAGAYAFYGHSPVTVGIDIYNLETEAYGATVERPDGNETPAIVRRICADAAGVKALPLFDPKSAGRIPMALDAAMRLAADLPGADVRVPVSGPFSIAAGLLGIETLLCEAACDPDGTRDALFHLVEGQARLCREVHSRGLGIAFFESAAAPPLLSPEMFGRIELPPLKALLEATEAIFGRKSPCIIGGNTEPVIEMILETGANYVICPSETDQAAFMKKMARHPHVKVRINMNPAVMTTTDEEALFREIDRAARLAAGRENVCIGTGSLPFEAVKETVLKARDIVLAR